jgi:hypothetical protein
MNLDRNWTLVIDGHENAIKLNDKSLREIGNATLQPTWQKIEVHTVCKMK